MDFDQREQICIVCGHLFEWPWLAHPGGIPQGKGDRVLPNPPQPQTWPVPCQRRGLEQTASVLRALLSLQKMGYSSFLVVVGGVPCAQLCADPERGQISPYSPPRTEGLDVLLVSAQSGWGSPAHGSTGAPASDRVKGSSSAPLLCPLTPARCPALPQGPCQAAACCCVSVSI